MNFKGLNTKLERSPLYIFARRHKKVINVVQGLIVIGLLIGINTYIVKDYSIKKQIAERCGYTTSRYECVCEKNYVDNYKEIQKNNFSIISVPDEVMNNWSSENVDP